MATTLDVSHMSWREKRDLIRRADQAIARADEAIASGLEHLQHDLAPEQLERELAAEPALGIGRSTSDDI